MCIFKREEWIPLTGVFGNPEFDDVVLLSELDESDSTETRHDKAEGNVGEGM